jgi:ABC-2 type transport system ATP-binding protein
VLLLGRPATDPAARARVGYLPELFRYQPWLSATEVLELHTRLSGVDVTAGQQRECLTSWAWPSAPAIGWVASPKGCSSASAGRRPGGQAGLVVLDEPTSALDPLGRVDVRDIVLPCGRRAWRCC